MIVYETQIQALKDKVQNQSQQISHYITQIEAITLQNISTVKEINAIRKELSRKIVAKDEVIEQLKVKLEQLEFKEIDCEQSTIKFDSEAKDYVV